MLFFTSSFIAQARVAANLRIVSSEAVVEVGTSIILVLLGAGAAGAAAGRTIGYVFGAVLALVVATRHLGRSLLRGRWDGGMARRLTGYASALLIVDGAFTLFGALDCARHRRGAPPDGGRAVRGAEQADHVLHYPGLAVASGVAPRLARHRGSTAPRTRRSPWALRRLIPRPGDPDRAARRLGRADRAAPARRRLPRARSTSSRAFAPYVFLSGLAPLVSLGVNYLGEARRRLPIAIAIVIIHFAILIVLVPAHRHRRRRDRRHRRVRPVRPRRTWWICRRLIDLPLRPVLAACARVVVAATAMGLVLWGARHRGDLGGGLGGRSRPRPPRLRQPSCSPRAASRRSELRALRARFGRA